MNDMNWVIIIFSNITCTRCRVSLLAAINKHPVGFSLERGPGGCEWVGYRYSTCVTVLSSPPCNPILDKILYTLKMFSKKVHFPSSI